MTKWEPVLSSRNIAFSLRLKSSWKTRYKGKWTSPKCSNESTTTQVIELSTRPIRVANNLGGEKATSNFPDNQRSPKTSWTDQEFVVKIKEKKSIEKTWEYLETLLTYLETLAHVLHLCYKKFPVFLPTKLASFFISRPRQLFLCYLSTSV